jgi:hypothetical protein
LKCQQFFDLAISVIALANETTFFDYLAVAFSLRTNSRQEDDLAWICHRDDF